MISSLRSSSRSVQAALLVLVLAVTLGTATDIAGAGVFPYRVERTTLDNGLKVLLIPMASEKLVAYWTVVRTGSRDEVEEGVTGFAHFFEHVMFKGSEKYPGSVYEEIVTSMGADANAYTTDDLTAYHLSITRDDLPKVIDIEADRFQNLRYTEDEFKTESGAVYGEYRKGRTNPFFTLYEAFSDAAFDRHTYQHTTIGFERDIKKMPEQYEYSKSFFSRFYRPDNVVIMVTGDFDSASTLELIKKHYGGWKKGYAAPKVEQEPEQKEQRRIMVPFDGQTLPILSVNFKGERLLPDDRTMMAATLIEELSFGETAPLYKKLVLEEQRLQFLSGDFGYNRDPGLWSVYAMVKEPADTHAVEAEIWQTVEQLQKKGVSQARLDAVRSHLKYGFLSSLSTPNRVAGNLARLVAITGDVAVVDQMFETLEKVTPDDVREAARRYLTPARSTVAVLHPKDEPIPARAAGGSATGSAAAAPVLLPVKDDPNVAVKLWFKVGSQDDPEGKEGLANLTARMVSEAGTASHSYDEILAALFPLAANYSASVDKEMTVITGGSHRDAFKDFYPLLVDAVLEPGFREEDFERIKSHTIETIEKQLRYSSDEELGKAALHGTVFRGTPYEHIDLGTVKALKAITLDDVRAFYKRHYTRDNVTLAFGGAYASDMVARLEKDLKRLPAGAPAAPPAPKPAPVKGRKVVLVEKPGNSTAISFGYPIDVGRGEREFYALWLANSWLGEHRNSVSHLYQVIREARGMNYGDYSYIEAFPNGGRRNMPPTGVGRRKQLFEVWIRPVPQEQALFALRAAIREIDRLIAGGLSEEQVEAQRNFLKKYSFQFATTTSARLGYAVDDRYHGLKRPHLQTFRETMPELTREEVNAAIKKHLQTDDLVIAMVTEDAEAMKKALVSGAPSPIDYGEVTKPAAILEEDKEIERYPLKISADDVRIIKVDDMFAK